MKPLSLAAGADLLAGRLDQLARISEEKGKLTRTFLSPAMDRANELVGAWMREAGLAVREDIVGNVVGRLEATRVGAPGAAGVDGRARTGGNRRAPSTAARTLLFGSHLDTVRDAGRFDGALGVVLPIIAISMLRSAGVELPFAVEVIGFSEEEAVRFPCVYIGSKAYAGRLRATDLAVRDSAGRTLRQAIEAHAKKKFSAPTPAHSARELLGYVEVHIEQGPVLEKERLAVGVVAAIASQTRGRFVFHGQAGHAGTTPMALRRDALAGAAEFMQAVEAFAQKQPPLVATVGVVEIPGGASNVIPGAAVLSLDVRHPDDDACRGAVAELVRAAERIARCRRLTVKWERTGQHRATHCSPGLTEFLAASVQNHQRRCVSLVSGAGHDAVVMAELAPMAMLFVRCREGLSHHPDEDATPADLKVALAVVVDFIQRLAASVKS